MKLRTQKKQRSRARTEQRKSDRRYFDRYFPGQYRRYVAFVRWFASGPDPFADMRKVLDELSRTGTEVL